MVPRNGKAVGQSRIPLAAVRSLARSSPRQTFVLIPLLTLLGELVLRRRVSIRALWLALCVGGYTLYAAAGAQRRAERAGPAGFARPPDRLLTSGLYAWSRNPMYFGHRLFLAGLALATGSPIAVAGLMWQWLRLGERVRVDEERLERIFGDEYREYMRRVPRWALLPAETVLDRSPARSGPAGHDAGDLIEDAT